MITENDIREALKRSGYLIESRVSAWFGENEFFVEPNFTFFDEDSQKSREIDLYVDKNNSFVDDKLKYVVNTNFIIETINNNVPIVFFLNRDSINEDNVFSQINYYSNFPGTENDYLFLIDYRKLHYFSNLLATQYCSFVEKKRVKGSQTEWMAYHPEDLYNNFLKLLFCSENILANAKKESKEFGQNKWHSLFRYQPVLILNDELIEATVKGNDLSLSNKKIISFSFNHTYSDRHRSIIIDVITESFLPEYINLIGKEDKIIFKGIRNHHIKTIK